MGFLDIYCITVPFLDYPLTMFFFQKFSNFGNLFNFFVFIFSLLKKKVLMINYFCNKKLKASIIEMFYM